MIERVSAILVYLRGVVACLGLTGLVFLSPSPLVSLEEAGAKVEP